MAESFFFFGLLSVNFFSQLGIAVPALWRCKRNQSFVRDEGHVGDPEFSDMIIVFTHFAPSG